MACFLFFSSAFSWDAFDIIIKVGHLTFVAVFPTALLVIRKDSEMARKAKQIIRSASIGEDISGIDNGDPSRHVVNEKLSVEVLEGWYDFVKVKSHQH